MKPVIGTLITTLIVAVCAVFGYAVTPEDSAVLQAVLGYVGGLPAGVQAGLLVASLVLLAVPHIAPYTPWTWDDWTIRFQTPAGRVLSRVWNALAGNYGRADNERKD